jgi:hypothetical protein
MELIDCTRDEARVVELAARLITSLSGRTLEDLGPDEFEALVRKTVVTMEQMRREIANLEDPKS